MSRRRHRRGAGFESRKATIDMNSLIDLTFLLLVTFMLTIPALEQGISVILPRGKTDTLQVKEHKPLTVTIDAENRCFLGQAPTTLEALEKTLLEKVAEDPETPVLVRGDERLSYGAVMDVVKLVHKCKVKRMSLVTVEK